MGKSIWLHLHTWGYDWLVSIFAVTIATPAAAADAPATIPELDDDALLAIFMHLPAPALMTAMACSRGWRNIVRQSDVLWLQKLSEDFPMYDRIPMSSPLPDVLASNRRTHPGWAKASAIEKPGAKVMVKKIPRATRSGLGPSLEAPQISL